MGTSIACRAIGGDFFEYLDFPDGSFGFALGDVSGKGPPAALLTAVLQGLFVAQAFAPAEPKDVIDRVNRALIARGVEEPFATVFFGLLRPDGRLTYCNAGHNAPFLRTEQGVVRLDTGGMIVGLFPGADYQQETIQLGPSDTITIFSDGVSEALSVTGEEFGDDRIAKATRPARTSTLDWLLQELLSVLRTFTHGAAQNDDITAMVVRYTGPAVEDRT
jgi:sigma-B regulation protein RsbU (phosphoserine phosphatase)